MKWLEYYKGKTVLVTGHTGFKGSWLCVMLEMAGAKVVGYALPPEKDAVLFDCSGAAERMVSVEGDIRDRAHLQEVFYTYQPQVVFHLAAQPIVRTSYEQPVYTYETNIMGTVNLLECVRNTPGVQSVLNVTTDKVYENKEWEWGYRENDPLDGFDPYSNSKSCSELVTHSYKKSFLDEKGCGSVYGKSRKCDRRRRFFAGPHYSGLCEIGIAGGRNYHPESILDPAISICAGAVGSIYADCSGTGDGARKSRILQCGAGRV